MRCQVTLAHVGQSLGIDDIVTVAGPKQLEEVGTVLRVCRAEPSKILIADLRAEAVLCLVSSSSVIHRDPGGA